MASLNDAQDREHQDDLQLLTETLEQVLNASGDKADEKYKELKSKAEEALKGVKSRISDSSDKYYYQAKKVACHAHNYVHDNPWQGVGIGATIGLVLGLLLAGRR